MGINVFITGAGGYLGSVLAAQLAKLPDVSKVTGTINRTMPQIALPDHVKLIKMDVRSPEMAKAMAGHDFVIHSASIVQWPASMPLKVRDEINFNGVMNVARAAVKNGVQGFLQASSLAAYDPRQVFGKDNVTEDFPIGNGKSSMYYWNSKAIAEKILNEIIGPTSTVLSLFRICYIIGPMNTATIPGFRTNAALFTDFDPRQQFVHEDDVAEVFAMALHTEMRGGYNVAADDFIHLSDIYRMIGVKPITVPVWLARLVTYVRWRYFGSPTHPSWVDATRTNFSVSNAKLKACGWMPHYSSEEAFRTAL
jgi:UDP-glucose 4-epimerase